MKKEITISFEHISNVSELRVDDQELVKLAKDVAKYAYAPFSGFHVGASLRLADGTTVTGSNQENVAFPSGLCAERVALFYAGANFSHLKIDTLCVVAEGEFMAPENELAPCGSCRQVMLESEERQGQAIRVLLVNANDSVNCFDSAADFLPLSFKR